MMWKVKIFFCFYFIVYLVWNMYLGTIILWFKLQAENVEFAQWETHSKNHQPIRVFVNKLTENSYRLRYFVAFIQNIESYPTSLGTVSILTWILLVISSQWFSCKTKLFGNLLLRKYLISVAVALMVLLE